MRPRAVASIPNAKKPGLAIPASSEPNPYREERNQIMSTSTLAERVLEHDDQLRYQVQRRTFGGPWRIMADDLPDTAFTDDDVEPGVEYEYRVRAKNKPWHLRSLRHCGTDHSTPWLHT